MTTKLFKPELYIPTPDAGAALLQIAFENLLGEESDITDTQAALETAFRGVARYKLGQEAVSGQFCLDSVSFVEKIGAQGYLGIQPIILVEEPLGEPTEIRLALDKARIPLFTFEPIKHPSEHHIAP